MLCGPPRHQQPRLLEASAPRRPTALCAPGVHWPTSGRPGAPIEPRGLPLHATSPTSQRPHMSPHQAPRCPPTLRHSLRREFVHHRLRMARRLPRPLQRVQVQLHSARRRQPVQRWPANSAIARHFRNRACASASGPSSGPSCSPSFARTARSSSDNAALFSKIVGRTQRNRVVHRSRSSSALRM